MGQPSAQSGKGSSFDRGLAARRSGHAIALRGRYRTGLGQRACDDQRSSSTQVGQGGSFEIRGRMEGDRQLDLASCAPTRRPLIRLVATLVLLGSVSVASTAQSAARETSGIAHIKELVAEQRWQEIVRSVETVPTP